MSPFTPGRLRGGAAALALAGFAVGLAAAFTACAPTVGQTGVILAIQSDTPVDCVDIVAAKPGGEPVTRLLTLPAQAHTEFRAFRFRALVYSGGQLGDGAVVLSASGRRRDASGQCSEVEVASGAAAFSFTRGKTPEVPVQLRMTGPDADGDGFADAFDCAPNDPTIFPREGPEQGAECGNDLDDDCDGSPDDGCPCTVAKPCYPLGLTSPVAGVGQCRLGSEACLGGVLGECAGAVLPTAEQCDGLDEDCDGTPDPPSCPCTDGDERPCYDAGPPQVAGVGRCAMGHETCHAGEWSACVGAVAPAPETCNGEDDDCNGVVDDPGLVATPLCANQQGVCVLSRATCESGESATCGAADYQANAARLGLPADAYATHESCDGVDNNCDGTIDEGCSCTPGTVEPCHPLGPHDPRASTGSCRLGTRKCGSNSQWGACEGYVAPTPETCNGEDDDCDGVVDDDVPGTGGECPTGLPGVCAAGTMRCEAGLLRCVPTTGPSPESCDGKDDDCNGVVDDGFDKQNDPAHCGGATSCEACATGDLCCAGHCSDSGNDPLNCGGCGKACGVGESCCDGGCFDLNADPAHCGRCDDACGTGEVCRQGSCHPPAETDCTNGVDDDGDGLVDCADVADCPVEAPCAVDPNGATTKVCRHAACVPVVETDCANGVDDDGDGKIDCADADCTDGTRCGQEDGYSKWCRQGRCVPAVELRCDDGVDDDGDGKIDCADADCHEGTVCDDQGGVCSHGACAHETKCGDGTDDDGDGKVDCADPDCAAKSCDGAGGVCANGACAHETSCANGIDDNGDGKVDCADTLACPSGVACAAGGTCCAKDGQPVCAHETSCSDGVDNDCDGLVDCQDPDCPACQNGTTCCAGGACRDLVHDVHNCLGCGNDCDDHNPCTADSCGATGCVHTPIADRTGVPGCEGESLCCNGRCVGAHESGAECTSGVDNDCDGRIGCQDSDCACASGTQCCGTSCVDVASSLTNCGACGNACPAAAECHVATCGDGACGTALAPNGSACSSVAGGQCHDGACVASHETAASCANGVDDDFDGLVDCQDPDCAPFTVGLTFCPGVHRCLDLRTDADNCGACGVECGAGVTCSNGACVRETTGDHFPFALTCADGNDNDGDGRVDCADPDCVDGSQCSADGKAHCCGGTCHQEICNNGVDDDCDGLPDCLDPDCLHQACDDGNACTTGETCEDTKGTCGGGTDTVCPPPDACQGGQGACNVTSGGCVYPIAQAGTVCRTAAGACDVTDVCDGVHTFCPTDQKKPANTSCADDDNPCTRDVCDGVGDACTHPPGNPGAPCRPVADACDVAESCTGSSATCPADAFVPAGGAGSPSCAPYVCSGTAVGCPTGCTSDAGCDAKDYCSGGVCVAKEPPGQVCGATDQCLSGECVDGVCCNTACGGACDACNLPGKAGTCSPMAKGTGIASCSPYLCNGTLAACPTSCSADGDCIATEYCSGNVCTPKKAKGLSCSATDQCETGECADGVCCDTACGGACDACNLAGKIGTCSPRADGAAGSPACAPYLCDGTAASCPTTCQADGDCVSGDYCKTNTCVPRKADGQGCGLSDECTSGECVDGFCCNAACDAGDCEACDVAGKHGVCTTLAIGAAGEPSCAPYLCNGSATSCPTTCTADSDCVTGDYCASGSPRQCKPKKSQGETCGGAHECGNGLCVDGYCCNTACGNSCDACDVAGNEGTCKTVAKGDEGDPSCAPYICNGSTTTCPVACLTNGDCDTADGAVCYLLSCTFKKADGVTCATSAQCAGGNCVDGVCCNTACSGACDACNLPGEVGTCTPVSAGVAGTPTCAPLVCNGTSASCPGSCSADTDCVSGDYCASGTCTPKKTDGGSCSATKECTSGFCVDGLCCDSACSGACDTCSATAGTCTVATGTAGDGSCGDYLCGTDASCPTSCTQDSDCASGTYCDATTHACVALLGSADSCTRDGECSTAHCADGVCCNAACGGACDACDLPATKGTCTFVSGSDSTCAPFTCNGSGAACPTACTSNADCAADHVCVAPDCLVADGSACTADADCASGACDGGTSTCLASNGQACATAADCASGDCASSVCAACTGGDCGAGTCDIPSGRCH